MVRRTLTKNRSWRDIGGIYKITNTVNGKVYIGRTICFYKRSAQYTADFRSQNSHRINEYLLKSMTKHGIDKFTFSVIEVCDPDQAMEREYFWMDYFNSYNREIGYNLRRDNEGGMIVHEETRKKISNRLKKEWSEGIRSGHSEKLKESWDRRDREEQGRLLSKIKTKYFYEVYLTDEPIICDYKNLKAMGLAAGCLSSFSRWGSDDVVCKGIRVVRKKTR